MRVLILLALCCISAKVSTLPTKNVGVETLSEKHSDRSTEGPEDAINRQIFIWIREHMEDVKDVVKRTSHLAEETKQQLVKVLNEPRTKDAECDGCATFVDFVRLFLDLGIEYEDVESVALDVCEVLLAFEGYKGEIICPGVVPNFGPHLFTIFGTTQNTSTEVCEVLEFCDPVQEPRLHRENKQRTSSKRNPTTSDKKESDRVPLPFNGLKTHKAQNMVHNAKKKITNMKGRNREKRQADVIKLAHFTDVHVEFDYVPGSATDCGLHMCCRNETDGTGSAGPFGSFTCNIPPATIQMFLQYLSDLQPDAVLYTGDTPSNAVWAETNQRQLNGTIWLGQQIAQYLPDVPAYFTIGNHETFPTNLYYLPRPETAMLHQAYIDHWGPLAGFGEEQIDTLRDGGYYSVLLRPGLRILCWNSNFGASSNWYNILNHYRSEYFRMQSFARSTLQGARDSGEKVIVLSHHPVGGGLRYYTEWETQLIVEYGDVILLHPQGHNHGDEFRVFVDPATLEPRSYLLSAPSMSTSPRKNPSARLFYLDADTMEVLDYEQYFLYLGNQDGLVEDPEIALWYAVKNDYGHSNLTAAGWLDFVYRMSEDADLFNRYLLNRDTLYETEVDCTGDCVIDHLCDRIETVEGSSVDCPLRA